MTNLIDLIDTLKNDKNIAKAKRLIKSGVDINVRDEYNTTALHVAALNGHLDICKILVERGANAKANNDLNYTPLDFANKLKERKKAELEELSNSSGVEPEDLQLLRQEYENYTEIANLLTEHNAKDSNKTTKFYNSGLYTSPFFLEYPIDFSKEYIDEDIEYNKELFTKYFKDDFEANEEYTKDQIDETFWDKISLWNTYFRPLLFNEEIALECNLIPFRYKGRFMLALNGLGMGKELFPKLDAYQALTDGTIDRGSRLFSDRKYFEYVVGEDITLV
jgi:hypothetical protein